MSAYRIQLSSSNPSSPVYLSSPTGEMDIIDFFSAGSVVADRTKASIPLLRNGSRDYADEVSEALIHILENFAHHSEPALPIKGQLWYKSDTRQLRVCMGTNPTQWGYVYTSPDQINAAPAVIVLGGDVDQTVNQTFTLNSATNRYDIPIKLAKTMPAGHSSSTVYSYPTLRVSSDGRILEINSNSAPSQGVPWASATNTRVSVDRDLNAAGKLMEGGNALLPAGAIIMWHGASIPAGWASCNGQNGTPDLRDRFVVGSSSSKPNGSTGGSTTLNGSVTTSSAGGHTHTVTGGNHSHGTTDGHTLTVNEIPRHQHATNWGESSNHSYPKYGTASGGSRNNIGSRDTDYDNYEYMTSWVGGDQAHSHAIPDGGAHAHAISTVPDHNHTVQLSGSLVPPYYAMQYIMKL